MQTIICKDFDAMSKWAAEKVAEEIRRKPDALISFPGGDTPLGMVHEFARMVNAGEIDISKARFVMLDEWVGLNENDEGSCARFMKDNLFDRLEKPFAEVCLFDGRADDIEAERAKHEAFIKEHGPITVSVLGIGMNGHLGFNESGVDFSLSSHIIPLHPEHGVVLIGIQNRSNLDTQGFIAVNRDCRGDIFLFCVLHHGEKVRNLTVLRIYDGDSMPFGDFKPHSALGGYDELFHRNLPPFWYALLTAGLFPIENTALENWFVLQFLPW